MSADVVLQLPPKAEALFLLYHGVGSTPQNLAPLGERLAREFPQAAVVSVAGPDPSDLGAGLQWFSVRGVTEENRAGRIAATLPRFEASVRAWQERTGTSAATTTLVGFSQGAILSLAAAQAASPVAARVASLSGRFANLPLQAPQGVRLHFLHGDVDPVVPAAHAQQAAAHLQSLGAAATLDIVPGLGHGISRETEERLLQHLRQP